MVPDATHLEERLPLAPPTTGVAPPEGGGCRGGHRHGTEAQAVAMASASPRVLSHAPVAPLLIEELGAMRVAPKPSPPPMPPPGPPPGGASSHERRGSTRTERVTMGRPVGLGLASAAAAREAANEQRTAFAPGGLFADTLRRREKGIYGGRIGKGGSAALRRRPGMGGAAAAAAAHGQSAQAVALASAGDDPYLGGVDQTSGVSSSTAGRGKRTGAGGGGEAAGGVGPGGMCSSSLEESISEVENAYSRMDRSALLVQHVPRGIVTDGGTLLLADERQNRQLRNELSHRIHSSRQRVGMLHRDEFDLSALTPTSARASLKEGVRTPLELVRSELRARHPHRPLPPPQAVQAHEAALRENSVYAESMEHEAGATELPSMA